MTVRLRALATVALLLAVAGCGADGDDSGPRPVLETPRAAEPATAPRLTKTPAGTVTHIGDEPQGIVFDPKTQLLAVAVRQPYRLLLLDPATLAVRTSIPLPGKARHLQDAAPGGPVLVAVESAAQLVEVFLPDGSTRETEVGHHPHDASAASNGDVAVANEFGGSVSVIRGGRVVHTFADLDHPGGVAAAGTDIAVVDVRAYTLSTYDLATMRRTGRVPAGRGPTHVAVTSRHRIVVTDTRGGRLLVYSLHPLSRVGSVTLGGNPYGLASDPTTGTVWVTLTARNELVGVDVGRDIPRVFATYPTVRQPDTVAVAPGGHTLWVTGTADGVVQRITR